MYWYETKHNVHDASGCTDELYNYSWFKERGIFYPADLLDGEKVMCEHCGKEVINDDDLEEFNCPNCGEVILMEETND